MEQCGLHQRIALQALLTIGRQDADDVDADVHALQTIGDQEHEK